MSSLKYCVAHPESSESQQWEDFLSAQPLSGVQLESCSLSQLQQSGDEFLFIVSGGDGSLNASLAQLIEAGLLEHARVVYLPCGTGNDFSRSTGLFGFDRTALMNLVENGACQEVHYASLGDRYFINMLTAGAFAEITPQTSGDHKALIGRWAYFIEGLKTAANLQSFDLEFQRDQHSWEKKRVYGFFVGNARFSGGGVQLTPEADPSEESVDLLIVEERPLPELVRFGLALQTGAGDPTKFGMTQEKVKSFRFRSSQKISMSLDGEGHSLREGEVVVSSGSLKVYMPREK